MSTRARIIDADFRTVQVNVYGPAEGAAEAIARVLPEPKRGTREVWAAGFYNTGVTSGKGTIWAWFA